jgi:hypothetical protein
MYAQVSGVMLISVSSSGVVRNLAIGYPRPILYAAGVLAQL